MLHRQNWFCNYINHSCKTNKLHSRITMLQKTFWLPSSLQRKSFSVSLISWYTNPTLTSITLDVLRDRNIHSLISRTAQNGVLFTLYALCWVSILLFQSWVGRLNTTKYSNTSFIFPLQQIIHPDRNFRKDILYFIYSYL